MKGPSSLFFSLVRSFFMSIIFLWFFYDLDLGVHKNPAFILKMCSSRCVIQFCIG